MPLSCLTNGCSGGLRHWSSLIAIVLIGAGLGIPEASATPPQSRFYDFTETVISGEQKVPGLEYIVGRKPASGTCDGLEADDFRRCLGEVRDIFRYIPKEQKQLVDVIVIPFGQSGVKELWRLSRHLTRGLVHKKASSRLILHPHPTYWGAAAGRKFARLPHSVEVNRMTRTVAEKSVQAFGKAMMGLKTPIDSVRSLYHVLTNRPEGTLRDGAHLGIVMLAREMPDTALFPEVIGALNERYGPSGWGATVLCTPAVCHAFDPFTRRPGGRIISVGSKESKNATKFAVEDAVWQANRWTLSFNPGLSGYMELRSSDRVLEKTSFAYDPFERRVRISGRSLPFDEHRRIEAWYFPFDPLQALAKVCPQAVEKRGRVGSALPCRDWMADEVISPQPNRRIEIRVVGMPQEQKGVLPVIEEKFRDVLNRRRVELAWAGDGAGSPWRLDTFRVVLCMKPSGCEPQGEDAMIPWLGDMELDTIETTAWRTLNRSTRVPITGTPLIYDTLQVYLNGRPISETTKDGAGYVLKGDTLYLDVAAPLHPDSHVFIVYRKDRRRK